MELLSFLILGIFVGILGSLLGIGGGVVIVPLLVFAWGYEPQVAIGTSVLVVLLNSISGTLGYMRKKQVCVDAAIKFAIATVPGAFLAAMQQSFCRDACFMAFSACSSSPWPITCLLKLAKRMAPAVLMQGCQSIITGN